MVKLLEKAGILALIKAVGDHYQNADVTLQQAGIQCLAHAAEHGDATLMDRLVKTLGKRAEARALVLWTKKFSPITWNAQGEVSLIKSTLKAYKPFDVEAADAVLIVSFKPTVNPYILDELKLIGYAKGLMAKVTKAEETGEYNGDILRMKTIAQRIVEAAERPVRGLAEAEIKAVA